MPVSYDNMQPSVAITEAIALGGIFPPRDVGTGTPGYLGSIRQFAFNFAPNSTLDAHGQQLSISGHTALFSLMGTYYGGNGITTFAIPDLNNRLSVDQGQGPGLADHSQGELYGLANTTLLSTDLPSAVGGFAQPVDNTAPSLAVHYVINVFGTYSGGQLDEMGLVWQFAGNFDPGGTLECDGRLLPISEYDALFSKIGTMYGGDGITTFALPDLRGRAIVGANSTGTDIGTFSGSENVFFGTNNLPTDVHFATGTGAGQPVDNEGPTLTMRYIIAVQGIFPSHEGNGSLDATTPMLGEIIAYAGTDIPAGWMACNGQMLPINQNQALFALLGTMYGGNGQTTFALPDFAGRALVGADGDVGTIYGTDTILLGLDNVPGMTIEGTAGNDDGISGFDLAGANDGDVIRGLAGSDVLIGRGGDDFLDGGNGIDTMIGGLGNDFYVVNRIEDLPVEAAGEGTDQISTALDVYSLGGLANIENLTGLGNVDQQLTGNAANNRIDGGIGTDVMVGDLGDDRYVVDNVGDVVVEDVGEGTDTIFSSIDYALPGNVENLTLSGGASITGQGNNLANVIQGNLAANLLLGGGGNDTLQGNGGNDTLDGGVGADAMQGGAGDDVYLVDNVLDSATEGFNQGIDTVKSTVSFHLTANVENLTLMGAGAINGTGNALANTITGNGADNRIDGGLGADLMNGGGGDDTYVVDNIGDHAFDVAGGGVDLVKSSVSFSLSFYIENLTLTGSADIDGTGNGLANVLIGNGGANVLKGANGNDQLTGLAGDDTLLGGLGDDALYGGGSADVLGGGDGNDILSGGLGDDFMTGGAGNDAFVFDTALSGANVDRVADFASGADHLQLSSTIFLAAGPEGTLGVDAFFAGTAAHDASDRIIYDSASGKIYYDADGTGAGAKILFAQVDPGQVLANTDFTIVGSAAPALAAAKDIPASPSLADFIWTSDDADTWLLREHSSSTHNVPWFWFGD